MKKAALIAAALTMVLTLAACGNMDKNNSNNGTNGINGTNDVYGTDGVNGTDNVNGTNGVNNANDVNGANGVNSANGVNGTSGVNGSTTRSSQNGTAANGSTTGSRSTVGSDLRRAADNVGDAATKLVDDGRDMVTRSTSATSFERMLDNARVHDRDGVLTDGENSRW